MRSSDKQTEVEKQTHTYIPGRGVEGRPEERTNLCTDGQTDGRAKGRMDEWMNRWTDGRMDEWMDGRTDGWTDERTDGRSNERTTTQSMANKGEGASETMETTNDAPATRTTGKSMNLCKLASTVTIRPSTLSVRPPCQFVHPVRSSTLSVRPPCPFVHPARPSTPSVHRRLGRWPIARLPACGPSRPLSRPPYCPPVRQ